MRVEHAVAGEPVDGLPAQPAAVAEIASRTVAAAGREEPSARWIAAWKPVLAVSSRKPKKLISAMSASQAERRTSSP